MGLIILVVVALGFDFTNGFHDAANAVAAAVGTRALRPFTALSLAAVLNVFGALISTKIAKTVGSGIIGTPKGHDALLILFCAVIGGIVWNLTTWWLGLPSSSTHALVGGLIGAALASARSVKWHSLIQKVVIPMAVSPLIGLALGFAAMVVIFWVFRRARPQTVNRRFRWAQGLSTAAMSYSHGTQDAQKTMGVITLALVTSGHEKTFHVPLWVILSAATAMGLGTAAGGRRIINTLGRRITPLDPPQGFAAQTSASAVLLVSAYAYAMPVSSTQVITGSIAGAGAIRRLLAVRWGVAREVLLAWMLTIPGAAISAAAVYAVAHFLVG